jgi:integrase
MAATKVKGKPPTDTQVKTLPAGPGGKAKYYSDTHGLYLIVRRPNSRDSRSFGFRGTLNGKQLPMLYLVSYPTKLSLEDARKERDRLNRLIKEGIDPRQERKKKNADTKPRTVDRLLDLYFKEKIEREREHDTAEKRHERIKKALWHIRLISKAIGGMLVKDVEPHHLLDRDHVGLEDLLDKSLNSGKERCRVLRSSFRKAVTRKWIKRDDNPASDEFFEDLFEGRFHISEPAASIDYVDAPRFVAAVKGYKNKGLGKSDQPLTTVPPLLFLIYTGVRTKEVRYAKWQQIRWNERLWEVPPENRKTGHLKHGAIRAIPISEAMLKVLNKMKARYPGEPPPDDLIFPGGSKFGGVARGSINAFIKGSLN